MEGAIYELAESGANRSTVLRNLALINREFNESIVSGHAPGETRQSTNRADAATLPKAGTEQLLPH